MGSTDFCLALPFKEPAVPCCAHFDRSSHQEYPLASVQPFCLTGATLKADLRAPGWLLQDTRPYSCYTLLSVLLICTGKPGAKAQAAAKSSRKKQTRKRKLDQSALATAAKRCQARSRLAEAVHTVSPAPTEAANPAAMVQLNPTLPVHSGMAGNPGAVLPLASAANQAPAEVASPQPATASPQPAQAAAQSVPKSPLPAPAPPPQMQSHQPPRSHPDVQLPALAEAQVASSEPLPAPVASQLASQAAALQQPPQQQEATDLLHLAPEIVEPGTCPAELGPAAQQPVTASVTAPWATAVPEPSALHMASGASQLLPVPPQSFPITEVQAPAGAEATPVELHSATVQPQVAIVSLPTHDLAEATPSVPPILPDTHVNVVGGDEERVHQEAVSASCGKLHHSPLGVADGDSAASAPDAEQLQRVETVKPELMGQQAPAAASELQDTGIVPPGKLQKASADECVQQHQPTANLAGLLQAQPIADAATTVTGSSAQHAVDSLTNACQPLARPVLAREAVQTQQSVLAESAGAVREAVSTQSQRLSEPVADIQVRSHVKVSEPAEATSVPKASDAQGAAIRHGQGILSNVCSGEVLINFEEQQKHQSKVALELNYGAKQPLEPISSVQEGVVTVLADSALLGLGAYGNSESDSDH